MLTIESVRSTITDNLQPATIIPSLRSEIDGWEIEGVADCDIGLLFAGEGVDELDLDIEYQQIRAIRSSLKPKTVDNQRSSEDIEDTIAFYSQQVETESPIEYISNAAKLYRNEVTFAKLLNLVDNDDLIEYNP
jgi:hypothetical protein